MTNSLIFSAISISYDPYVSRTVFLITLRLHFLTNRQLYCVYKTTDTYHYFLEIKKLKLHLQQILTSHTTK